jgi:hypothetical protein
MMDITANTQNQIATIITSLEVNKADEIRNRNKAEIQKIQAVHNKIIEDLVPELNSLEPEKIIHIKNCIENCLDNKEKLAFIKQKGDESSNLAFCVGAVATVATLIFSIGFSFIGIPLSVGAYRLLENSQRIQYISRLMEELILKFEHEDIELFPCLKLDGLNDSIDLFIKFPNRKFFMVSIQAIGKNTLFYSNQGKKEHQRDGLYLRSHRGSRKSFNSKNLEIIPTQEKLFRQQHRSILGSSVKDAKSGIIKILGIFGKEAKLTNFFPPALTEKNDPRDYYLAQKNPSIFVMREEEIIEFIEIKIKKKRS